MYDFLVVGHLAIDEVHVDNRIRFGIGGSSYYCGFNLSLLGWRVRIISKIGFDFNPYLDRMKSLDISLVKISSKPTTRYQIVYNSNYERTLKLLSKCEDISESDIPSNLEVKAIHICPIANEININAIFKLKEFNGVLSIDTQGLLRAFRNDGRVYLRKPRNIFNIVRDIDILKADQFEIKVILNSLKDISRLFDIGVKIVVVTSGSSGVTIYTCEEVINVPAPRIYEVKDPTGAGDVFMAGFLHGYLKGMNIVESALYGIASASSIIRKFENRFIDSNDVDKLFCILRRSLKVTRSQSL
ncbi:MAG: PfkB family carbohydrate kinase [Candidatus Methanomethylicia archaeon]